MLNPFPLLLSNRGVDFESLAPHRFELESHLGLDYSCDEAIQLAYGMLVVLLRCWLVPDIIHGGAPKVFPDK